MPTPEDTMKEGLEAAVTETVVPDKDSDQEAMDAKTKVDREYIETRRHDFETLYKYMKTYYQDENLTLLEIEDLSPKLAEIIGSFREVLQAAGMADIDGLLKGLLTEVRRNYEENNNAFLFVENVFDHTKMNGGPVQKFYESFVAGLKAQQELKQQKVAA